MWTGALSPSLHLAHDPRLGSRLLHVSANPFLDCEQSAEVCHYSVRMDVNLPRVCGLVNRRALAA